MMEHTQIIEPTEADPLTTTRSVKRPRFRVGRPQRLAALLLVLFLGECLWVIAHQELTTNDYRRYAESSGYTSDSALQAIASNASNFYNEPDPTSLTGIFNQIGADIAAGTSRING